MTTDRKAIAAAFRAAKSLLWDGVGQLGDKPCGLCLALSLTSEPGRHLAERLVIARLAGEGSLGFWLISKGVSRALLTSRNIQAHRHAWLDMLIAEFEGEEK